MTITMTPSRATTGSDFAVLSRRISGEGLMQRRPAYYLARLSVVTLMFLGGWTAFFLIGSSWWQLVTAVFLAVTGAEALYGTTYPIAPMRIRRVRAAAPTT